MIGVAGGLDGLDGLQLTDDVCGRGHRSVDDLEERQIIAGDGAPADQGVEVHHLVPELRAVQHGRNGLAHLARLPQRDELEQLVEGAEAAGHGDERLHHVQHPELSEHEVLELHGQLRRDVAVDARLEGQRDAHADTATTFHLRRTAVAGFHEARPTASADEILPLTIHGPLGEQTGDLHAVLVVGRQQQQALGVLHRVVQLRVGVGAGVVQRTVGHIQPGLRNVQRNTTGRSPHQDGVGDAVLLEQSLRSGVFGHHPHHPRVRRVHEALTVGIAVVVEVLRPLNVRSVIVRHSASLATPGHHCL